MTKPNARRNGAGLLEVIASLILLTMIVMPLASMIRGGAHVAADARGTRQSDRARQTIRWIDGQIRDATLVSPPLIAGRLDFVDASNRLITVQLIQDRLVYISGSTRSTLLENVTAIGFDMTVDPLTNATLVRTTLETRDVSGATIRNTVHTHRE